MFSGGALPIFNYGTWYHALHFASIFIQLLGIAVPYFQRMMREGESGRRKINQITRYLTVLICCSRHPVTLQPAYATA